MAFYVTGLPRSRTAWLARLFSFGESYCLHDAIARPGWREEVRALPFGAVGVSDSGFALRPPPDDGPLLIVRRDPAECLRSWLAMPPYPGMPPVEREAAARVLATMGETLDTLEAAGARVVKFEALDDEAAMRGAWSHLVGRAQPWSDVHWREMQRVRVVTKPEAVAWRS